MHGDHHQNSGGFLLRHSTSTTRAGIGGARSATGTRRIELPPVDQLVWDPFGLAAAALASDVAAAGHLQAPRALSMDDLIADLQVAVEGLAIVVEGLNDR